jgi:hypothetical protein
MIFYNFLKNLILNVKYTRILQKIYKDEDLLTKFSQLFGVEFRIDWVGRLYAVFNPNILNEKYDTTTQIFEYTDSGFSNAAYVEKYIMTKLNLVRDFIIANNMFDLLTYEIEKIDDYDNYLFVVKPITFDECKKWTKTFSIVYGCLIVVGIALLIIL